MLFSFVIVEYAEEGLFIAKIKYFVKVEVAEPDSLPEGNCTPLRYAIADLYKQRSASKASSDVGECFVVTKEQQPRPSCANYPVNVEDILVKVLWGETDKCENGKDHGFPSGAWCLVQYPHFQSYVDPQADVGNTWLTIHINYSCLTDSHAIHTIIDELARVLETMVYIGHLAQITAAAVFAYTRCHCICSCITYR